MCVGDATDVVRLRPVARPLRWTLDERALAAANGDPRLVAPPPGPTARRYTVGRHVAGAVIGGIGGFFVGGIVGAKLEPDCYCDDPGLTGFMIGAPVGVVLGAILGAKDF